MKKKQGTSHQEAGWQSVCACLRSEKIVSVKHATGAPSPCHPSEAKSKVTVLLNPSFLHTHTRARAHIQNQKHRSPQNTHTHSIPAPKYTIHMQELKTPTFTRLAEPSWHHTGLSWSHHGKVTLGPSQTTKEMRRVMEWENGASSFFCFS